MYKLINKTTDSSVLQLPGKANRRRGAERGEMLFHVHDGGGLGIGKELFLDAL